MRHIYKAKQLCDRKFLLNQTHMHLIIMSLICELKIIMKSKHPLVKERDRAGTVASEARFAKAHASKKLAERFMLAICSLVTAPISSVPTFYFSFSTDLKTAIKIPVYGGFCQSDKQYLTPCDLPHEQRWGFHLPETQFGMVAKETVGISASQVPHCLERIRAALLATFPERKSKKSLGSQHFKILMVSLMFSVPLALKCNL